MRVKIGDKWHDSKDEPICIQVSEVEQKHIADMDKEVAKHGMYASFPDGWDADQALRWMKQ